jgi:hypothetical protein|tara:strand:- start:102 stop:356 length:255 start_codon:yes stop_codon:yes gene_type:complete
MGFRRRKMNQRAASGGELRAEDDVEGFDLSGRASGLEKLMAKRQMGNTAEIERKSRIALLIILIVGALFVGVVVLAIRSMAPAL